MTLVNAVRVEVTTIGAGQHVVEHSVNLRGVLRRIDTFSEDLLKAIREVANKVLEDALAVARSTSVQGAARPTLDARKSALTNRTLYPHHAQAQNPRYACLAT